MNREADENTPLDAEQMLALMREQRISTRRGMDRGLYLILFSWAIGWFVGFLSMWSAESAGGNPWFRIPDVPAAVVFGACIVAASVLSIVGGISMGRGVRGRSADAGRYYGWSWSISMLGGWLFGSALLLHGMPKDLIAVFFPGLFIIIVGVLYMAGAGITRSSAQFWLGVVMVALVVLASTVGAPEHYLIYGLTGPAVMVTFVMLLRLGIISGEPAREGDERD